MNRKQFGKLFSILRKQRHDEDWNLITQEKLGVITGLGKEIIGKIERGEKAHFDSDTLFRLASGLNLTSLERKEFFSAAMGIEEQQTFPVEADPNSVLDSLVALLEKMQLPAFILDNYADIIAVNSYVLKLFEISEDAIAQGKFSPAGSNLLSFIFSPSNIFRNLVGAEWDRIAYKNILFFRRVTLRFLYTDYYQKLISVLKKNSQFAQIWMKSFYDQEDSDMSYELYSYNHLKYGRIQYLGLDSIIPTKFGDLFLITYVPANIKTSQIFSNLADVNNEPLILSTWPK